MKTKAIQPFITSKLGKRILVLFLGGALFPVICLAIISYYQVEHNLIRLNNHEIRQAVKIHGMSIVERLQFISLELELYGRGAGNRQPHKQMFPENLNKRIFRFFTSIGYLSDNNQIITLQGPPLEKLPLSPDERHHLRLGKPLLKSISGIRPHAKIYLARMLRPAKLESNIVIGEINPEYLWGLKTGNSLPDLAEFCVLDASLNILYNSDANIGKSWTEFSDGDYRRHREPFTFRSNQESFVAVYWDMMLKPQFLHHHWRLFVFRPEALVYQPIDGFKYTFGMGILITLILVFLLSQNWIRNTLQPLNLLKEGSHRLAARKFNTRVEITSKDEFQDLAESFNDMANQLANSFNTLATKSEIDRAILSALDIDAIAAITVTRMADCINCARVGMGILEADDRTAGRMVLVNDKAGGETRTESIGFSPEDLHDFEGAESHLILDADDQCPGYLTPIQDDHVRAFLVSLLRLKNQVVAFVAFGYSQKDLITDDESDRILKMTGQVAVAFANSTLVKDLNELNWGTLEALARAVDAKSSWTAGHSQRVTDMAVKIGKTLRLSKTELDNLHRGGLLHDIGKVGVSSAILNKPGKLTPAEFQMIKAHPGIGGRILKPVKAFESIMPMVLQHHEKFDGSGYPFGLAGEEIALEARIMAVADVYDALISDRPYRSGMPLERVVSIIQEESGRHFDPDVVNALLRGIQWKQSHAA
jgi:HD-GYP domain-containing protein (c-di-GMP phosphodiesterase class II)/HAMP domain-containing protein